MTIYHSSMIAGAVYGRLKGLKNRHCAIQHELTETENPSRKKVLRAAMDLNQMAIEYNQRCLDALFSYEVMH